MVFYFLVADCIADLNQFRDRHLAQIDTKERQLKMVFKFDIMKHKTIEQMVCVFSSAQV